METRDMMVDSPMTDEQMEAQRISFIKEYNANNTDSQILNKEVTEDDIKELENRMDAMKEARSAMTYEIADAENGMRVAQFLRDWNANDFVWVKDMWRGVLRFDEFINEQISLMENADTALPLTFDFGALTYVYNAMMQPCGTGLEAAKKMEAMSDEYDAILNTVAMYIDEFQEENKLFQRLGQCLGARYQGYYMVLAEDLCDEPADDTDDTTPDTDTADELPDNVVKL